MQTITDSNQVTFADFFAGIGGFHLAFHNLGSMCVAACEIDKYSRMTYEKNFQRLSPAIFEKNAFYEDIQKVDMKHCPNFDVLCAGFPCQPFSQAGYKQGFQDERNNRGNMFFQILKLLKSKRPKAFFLENVRHLIKHDDGKTFSTIEKKIRDLGYSFFYKVVFASDFGLPQHRPRVFIVGFDNNQINNLKFEFPEKRELNMFMSDIFGEPCNKSIGYTLRVGGRASGLNDRRNWDTYMVNGKIKVIGSVEGKRMQGFPDDFEFPVSETQAMKQLGNSVAVPAVQATAEKIIQVLTNLSDYNAA